MLCIRAFFRRCITIANAVHQINEEITDKEIRLIGNEGEQLGIMSAEEALRIAAERELDLVKIAPGSNPPVCKIMDYGENSTEVRERIISRLGALGIKLDKAANKKAHGVVAVLSTKTSKIPVVAIPTNEELAIAQDTVRVLG